MIWRNVCSRQLVALALVVSATLVRICAVPGGAQPPDADIPNLSFSIVGSWPHDRGSFTEGLVYWDGILIESTGLYGHSKLRKVELESGRVLQEIDLPNRYFGEGIAVLAGKIYQLTWESHKGFIYDVRNLASMGDFPIEGEGWGLTTDGRSLIMTDGTNRIRFLDPGTFNVTRTVDVFAHGRPVNNLNELEYVNGILYANVWQTSFILEIDPADGKILATIDFVGILPQAERNPDTDVMNGIAYDAKRDRLFVTGKNWPRIFEVKTKAR